MRCHRDDVVIIAFLDTFPPLQQRRARAFCCASEFHSLPIFWHQTGPITVSEMTFSCLGEKWSAQRGDGGANLPTDGDGVTHRGGGVAALEVIFVTNFGY